MLKAADLYIGLMSGTSMDGVDAVLVAFDETRHQAQVLATHLHPLPDPLKQKALAISLGEAASFISVAELDQQFGQIFSQAVTILLQKAAKKPSQVRAVGSHGQTLWHQPQGTPPFTLQIGDPNIIAKHTGIRTVADFRRGDMALGGQGAPFVPPFHEWLLGNSGSRVVLNIGGIANISLLPLHKEACLGFDTGPGNGLMDAWVLHHRQQSFDKEGAFAKQGTCFIPLLNQMMRDPYFTQQAPKSTGRDYFSLAWLEKQLLSFPSLPPEDVQATLLELSAVSIAQHIHLYRTQAEVFLCGGGAHNPVLREAIQAHLGPQFSLRSTEDYGVSPDWMEAICFAWYAKKRIDLEPIHLQSVTGSQRPVFLGGLFEA